MRLSVDEVMRAGDQPKIKRGVDFAPAMQRLAGMHWLTVAAILSLIILPALSMVIGSAKYNSAGAGLAFGIVLGTLVVLVLGLCQKATDVAKRDVSETHSLNARLASAIESNNSVMYAEAKDAIKAKRMRRAGLYMMIIGAVSSAILIGIPVFVAGLIISIIYRPCS